MGGEDALIRRPGGHRAGAPTGADVTVALLLRPGKRCPVDFALTPLLVIANYALSDSANESSPAERTALSLGRSILPSLSAHPFTLKWALTMLPRMVSKS